MTNITQQMTKVNVTHVLRKATANCILFYQKYKNINNTDLLQEYQQELQEYKQDFQQKLETVWELLCKIYAVDNKHWQVNDSNRGYLERKINDKKILVPYHLADYFPNQNQLDTLCNIAKQVQVSASGVICISGSSTFLGALGCISDIDYCEYAPFDKSKNWKGQFVENLNAQISQNRQNLLVLLVKIVCLNSDPIYLYQNEVSQEQICHENLSHAKMEFLTEFYETILEVTNLVLPINSNNQGDPTYNLSFFFQEAPITDGNWVPQRLLDPFSLGQYATWLESEVIKYAFQEKKNLIKAAKRALSLSRITGFFEEGDEIINTLNNNINYVRQNLASSSRIQEKLKSINNNTNVNQEFLQRILNHLNDLNNTIVNDSTHSSSDNNIDIITEICDRLIENIKNIKEEITN